MTYHYFGTQAAALGISPVLALRITRLIVDPIQRREWFDGYWSERLRMMVKN